MRSRGGIYVSVVVLLAALAVVVASHEQFPPGGACGGPSFKPDGTPWVCTFDDEFDSDHLDATKWAVQTNLPTGDPTVAAACFENTPQNVSVSAGALHLSVAREAQPFACAGLTAPVQYTAGQVNTYHLFSQLYGRFEARMRTTATTAPGLHEAFWLWPDDRQTPLNWPTTGEIDVAETYSSSPNLAIPYLHFRANDNGGPIDGFNTGYCAAQRGVWNTYDLIWTPTALAIAINGQTCLVNTTSDPAFNHRYILALSGTLGSSNDALTAATPIPATTDIDYVRVWQ
jgi:beta-glucanase (GH16 family)